MATDTASPGTASFQSLLTSATAAYGENGDSRVYFMVHEVDSDNRLIDPDEYPDDGYIESPLGAINGPHGHWACSLHYGESGRVAALHWLTIAKQAGAWILANRAANLTPLPDPASIWGIELLGLPIRFREYRKTAWSCNAFAATVEMLKRLTPPAVIVAAGEPAAAGKVSGDASPDAEERALAVLAKYPDLTTITAVAAKADCTREHLSRNCPRFKAAFSALKKTRQPSRIVHGSKSKDGNLEAWSNDEIDDD